MRVIGISDIHLDIENIFRFLEKIESLEPDIIVCCGDLLDAEIPKGFSPTEIGSIIIEQLSILKKPILITPGNFDAEILDLLRKEGVLLHGNGKIINGVGFYGFGGAKTPFNTPLEPEENEIKIGLENGYCMIEGCEYKIQVTHIPPIYTKLDLTSSGHHVGSKAVREFIENHHVSAALCGHIQEARGIDYIKNTVIINCGRFSEGYCSVLDIGEKIDAKIINLNLMEENNK